ncbi:MAG: hypothetical protein ACI85U_000130 [Candidatus Promineifilaceae bacterium]
MENPTGLIELSDENGGTKMRMIFTYSMKYGPIGAIMNTLLFKPQFGKALSGIPASLKY